MNLSSGFIKRPVATGLLMIAIVLLGAIAYELLPVAALPNGIQFNPAQLAADGLDLEDVRNALTNVSVI